MRPPAICMGSILWLTKESPEALGDLPEKDKMDMKGKWDHPILILVQVGEAFGKSVGKEYIPSTNPSLNCSFYVLLITSFSNNKPGALVDRFPGNKQANLKLRAKHLPLAYDPPAPHPDNGILLEVSYAGGKAKNILKKQSYVKLDPVIVNREWVSSLYGGAKATLKDESFQTVMTELRKLCPQHAVVQLWDQSSEITGTTSSTLNPPAALITQKPNINTLAFTSKPSSPKKPHRSSRNKIAQEPNKAKNRNANTDSKPTSSSFSHTSPAQVIGNQKQQANTIATTTRSTQIFKPLDSDRTLQTSRQVQLPKQYWNYDTYNTCISTYSYSSRLESQTAGYESARGISCSNSGTRARNRSSCVTGKLLWVTIVITVICTAGLFLFLSYYLDSGKKTPEMLGPKI